MTLPATPDAALSTHLLPQRDHKEEGQLGTAPFPEARAEASHSASRASTATSRQRGVVTGVLKLWGL